VMSPAARAFPRGMGVGPMTTRTDAGARGTALKAMSQANRVSENFMRCQASPCARPILMDRKPARDVA